MRASEGNERKEDKGKRERLELRKRTKGEEKKRRRGGGEK